MIVNREAGIGKGNSEAGFTIPELRISNSENRYG